MQTVKTLALVGTMLAGSVAVANAALVDFTDPATYTIAGNTGSGSVDGLSYTLTAVGGNFNNDEVADYDADRVFPLAGLVDGLGISDDEVAFPNQSVIVDFGQSVEISSLYFLDLFGTNPGGPATRTDEGVVVSNGRGDSTTFKAQTLNQDGTVGFGSFGDLSITGSRFTFTPTAGNDAFARPDFALAGIEAAAVPLPAGILLLGGALGGLGFARRRKQKTA